LLHGFAVASPFIIARLKIRDNMESSRFTLATERGLVTGLPVTAFLAKSTGVGSALHLELLDKERTDVGESFIPEELNYRSNPRGVLVPGLPISLRPRQKYVLDESFEL